MSFEHILTAYKPADDTSYICINTIGKEKRAYYLVEDLEEEFWRLYLERIADGDDDLDFCEVFPSRSQLRPLVVDLDLYVQDSQAESGSFGTRKLYGEEDVKMVIGLYQDKILEEAENLGIEIPNEALYCVLLEKSAYCAKGKYKNGFHLHFPFVYVNQPTWKLLCTHMKDNLSGTGIFAKIRDRKAAEDCVDESVVTWLLYGSNKSFGDPGYRVTSCYDWECNSVSLTQVFDKDVLQDCSDMLTDDETIRFFLPKLLSVTKQFSRNYDVPPLIIVKSSDDDRFSIDDELEGVLAEKAIWPSSAIFLSIKSARFDSRGWVIIGRAIHREFTKLNARKASRSTKIMEAGLYLWKKITHRAILNNSALEAAGSGKSGVQRLTSTDKANNLEKKWVSFAHDNIVVNLNTIVGWQKEDSLDIIEKSLFSLGNVKAEEKQFVTQRRISQMVASDDGDRSDYDKSGDDVICELFKEWSDYGNSGTNENVKKDVSEFLTDDILAMLLTCRCRDTYRSTENKDIWLKKDKVTFEEVDKKDVLRSLQRQMYVLACALRDKCSEDAEAHKKLVKLCRRLGSSAALNSASFFIDSYLSQVRREAIDCEREVIPFENCLMNLNTFEVSETPTHKTGEYVFTKSLPIKWVEFSEDAPELAELNRYFERVFPNANIRRYFLDHMSTMFIGGNPNKIAMFWLGKAHGGKSLTQTLFQKMFGKYAIKLGNTSITGEAVKGGSANPELCRTRGGVRMCVVEELNSKELIRAGTFKSLTGNDSFYARDLFQRGKEVAEITPMFKPIFINNTLPKFDQTDEAVWERVRVIPFESKFVKEGYPETHEECMRQKIFKADANMEARLGSLLEALAFMLINRLKGLVERGLVIDTPEEVLVACEKFRSRCDKIVKFLRECTCKHKDSTVTDEEMYYVFSSWQKRNDPAGRLTDKQDFDELLSNNIGEPEQLNDENGEIKTVWRGYRILKRAKNASQDEVVDDLCDA